ncbi:aldehyde dehydrogenase family protein [Dactylosporangium sp. CA-092794]|uniref:aldehyde dehydrogenase family protein n=1 Tax=Dactylosporangium sp. CA-092794 TaxID=3239929 RepID=UPI003D8FB7F8
MPEVPEPELYIGGRWVAADRAMPAHPVVNPTTEQVVLELGQASPQQAHDAIAAARAAFDSGPWPRLSPLERAEAMHAIADHLHAQRDRIAERSLMELGQPIAGTRGAVDTAIELWRRYADLAVDYPRVTDRPVDARRRARVIREPVGVVLAITPWNSPLLLSSLKVAAALAAGCTVVIKPASEGPLTLPFVAEAAAATGLPDGVLNLVYADAPTSALMVADPLVDMVSFTGSSAVGSEIMRGCAGNITRVALELGGKSASIVLEDADPAKVTPLLLASAGLGLAGQVCTSRARVLVPRSRHDEWLDAIATGLRALRVGDPADESTQVGPLATERQRQRVEEYIRAGQEEGARLVVGGGRPAQREQGWFVEPTLFDGVTSGMRIAQEEIFGPVLCVLTYNDVDDAVRIANDTEYGLAGSVYTEDIDAAYAIAQRVRSGSFQINTTGRAIDQPAGGMKKSGLGREGGVEGLEAFFEIRQIQVPIDVQLPDAA